MGEYEIITSLARDFMAQGDSAYWASRNAVVEYRIALEQALNYEYKEKKKPRVVLSKKEKREKIFNDNKGIVFKVANTNYSYFRKTGYFDDLLQEGFIALWKAIDTFDESKGKKFGSYAFERVWGIMGVYIERKIKCRKRYTDSKFNNMEFVDLTSVVINKTQRNNNFELLDANDVIEDERVTFIGVENKIATEQILAYAKKLDNIEGYEGIHEMLLLYLEGLSYRDISKHIGKSQNRAGERIRHFLYRYKNLIEREMVC